MKRSVIYLICMIFAVTATYAQNEKKSKGKESVTFQVDGMDCNNCVKKIEKNIAFEKGVTDLKCDLATRTAVITYKTDKTSPAALAQAFTKIGMTATCVTGENCCTNEPSGCCGGKKEGTEGENCCKGE
ncbi:MAG: heavy-metal-associated domain-containing protein [Tannerellaceae bacterium]|nr:heavy-metal-associated domain-containing protein [Tannerellaceae bacterium]